jgi:hypothetical protein
VQRRGGAARACWGNPALPMLHPCSIYARSIGLRRNALGEKRNGSKCPQERAAANRRTDGTRGLPGGRGARLVPATRRRPRRPRPAVRRLGWENGSKGGWENGSKGGWGAPAAARGSTAAAPPRPPRPRPQRTTGRVPAAAGRPRRPARCARFPGPPRGARFPGPPRGQSASPWRPARPRARRGTSASAARRGARARPPRAASRGAARRARAARRVRLSVSRSCGGGRVGGCSAQCCVCATHQSRPPRT